jgi:apolipoprotein N-acyltransferase
MSPATRTRRFIIDSTPAMLLAALIWALLMALSYPPVNLWPLAHVALVPLVILAVRGRPGLRRALAVYFVAVGWWLVMVSWLTGVTVPGYIALCLYLGLYPMLFVVVLGWLHRRLNLPLVFGVPLVWVSLEYLRGSWALTGFPWFTLGQSQPRLLIQIADFAGMYGVSFLVAMAAGAIMDVLANPLVRPGPGRRKLGRTVRLAVVCWLIGMFGSIGYGTWRLIEYAGIAADQSAQPTVAVIQTDVPQSNKLAPDDQKNRRDFDKALALTEKALAADYPEQPTPQLVVWPETMVPEALNEDAVSLFRRLGLAEYAAYRDGVATFAADHDVAILAGGRAALNWKPIDAQAGSAWRPGKRYNSAFLFGPDGQLIGRYDKVHRVVFGEYVPNWLGLRSVLVKLTPYDFDYSLDAGTQWVRFAVQWPDQAGQPRLLRFATPICFEDVVSYACRAMAYDNSGKRIDLLVNLTNDGWYPGSVQGYQHEQIARFRCVENRLPMARAVNRGVSGFIDSTGRITDRVTVDGEHQMVAGWAADTITFDPRSTWFGKVGDLFALLVLVLSIIWAMLGALVRKRIKEPG